MGIVNVEDARRAARRRLPGIFFDYIDGGASAEQTLAANAADFARWTLVPRALVDVSQRSLVTHFLGRDYPLPFMLGPVGFLGLYAGHGEVLAARAAHKAGIPLCLSSFSITSLAALRTETRGPLAFQLYVMSDRGILDEFLSESRAAGVGTLFLTVDTAVTSVRERDVRNGFRSLTRLTPGLVLRMLTRPDWCLELLAAGPPKVGAVAHRPEFGSGVLEQAGNLSRRIDTRFTWADVTELRERWPGRLVLKGILSAEDAERAVASGVDAIVVSNHGGRQLDGAASTIAVLPEIAAAVDGRIEVLFDGGVRRGADIVKALALGASGVLLGRAYVYGLAAAGEAGVARIIAHLAEEVDIALALMGFTSIAELKQAGRAALRAAG